jgi:hypothetical protein
MTIFLKPLPLDIASRVWDLYLLEGEVFLFKVMLGISLSPYRQLFRRRAPPICYLFIFISTIEDAFSPV